MNTRTFRIYTKKADQKTPVMKFSDPHPIVYGGCYFVGGTIAVLLFLKFHG